MQKDLDALPGWELIPRKLDDNVHNTDEIPNAGMHSAEIEDRAKEKEIGDDAKSNILSTPPSQKRREKLHEEVLRTPKEPTSKDSSTSLEQTMSGTPIEYYLEILRDEEQKEKAKSNNENYKSGEMNVNVTTNNSIPVLNADGKSDIHQVHLKERQVQDNNTAVQKSENSLSTNRKDNRGLSSELEPFLNVAKCMDLSDESESDSSTDNIPNSSVPQEIATQCAQQTIQQMYESTLQNFTPHTSDFVLHQNQLDFSQGKPEQSKKQVTPTKYENKGLLAQDTMEQLYDSDNSTKSNGLQQDQTDSHQRTSAYLDSTENKQNEEQIKKISSKTSLPQSLSRQAPKSAQASSPQTCFEQSEDDDMLDLSFSSLIKRGALISPAKQKKIAQEKQIGAEKRAPKTDLFIPPRKERERTSDANESNDNQIDTVPKRMRTNNFIEQNKKIDWRISNPLLSMYKEQ